MLFYDFSFKLCLLFCIELSWDLQHRMEVVRMEWKWESHMIQVGGSLMNESGAGMSLIGVCPKWVCPLPHGPCQQWIQSKQPFVRVLLLGLQQEASVLGAHSEGVSGLRGQEGGERQDRGDRRGHTNLWYKSSATHTHTHLPHPPTSHMPHL